MKSKTFRPINDGVLLRIQSPERMTANNTLWIPDNAKREAYELYVGTVVAVGPGELRKKDGKRNPVELAIGDRVQFYWAYGEMLPTRWNEGSDVFQVVPESACQAVIG